MVKCPECGKEVENNNFCGNCGAEIIKKNVCSNCGIQLDDKTVFCPNCGKKINDDSQEEENTGDDESNEETTTEIDESEKENSQKDTEDKEEDSQENTSTENNEENTEDEEKESQEDTSTENNEENTENEEEKLTDTDKKLCPYCNTKIEDDEVIFCPECGKSIEIDKQSLKGIKNTIEFKKLIIFTLISIGLTFLLSLVFSYIFGMIGPGDYYPIGFVISIILIVGIFGSFKEVINGGLLGLITGLVIGILSTYIVELSCGFKFSYMMLYGYGSVILTVLGLIMGIISSQSLRNSVKKLIDVEKIF